MGDKASVTMADIARMANVSKPTVSRALNNSPLVKKDTRDRILLLAHQYGFTVNRNAQKLRQQRTNTIAVSLDFRSHKENRIADPFMFDLLAGVAEALGERNQDLLLCAPSHNDVPAFRQILTSRGADGFIILGQGHRESMLEEFAATGASMVVWGAAPSDAKYCVVGSDNFLGGTLAGNYLIEKGCRRLLVVGDPSFREIGLRWEGLESAVQASGLSISRDRIDLHSFSFDATYDAALRFIRMAKRPPDGVFAFSDTAAMAVIRAFMDAGLQIPGDVSVVGYNDIAAVDIFSPRLTTIRQDTYQAGRLLTAKLMRILNGESPRSGTIKTELIVRET